MIKTSQDELQTTAQSLLDRYNGERHEAFADLMRQFMQYTEEEDFDMVIEILNIGRALRQLTTNELVDDTKH
jgi:hypothetical protein